MVRPRRSRCHPQAGGRRHSQPQGAVRPLLLLAAILAKRSMGRARPAWRRSQRVRAAGGIGARMTQWIEIGALDDIPRLGSRVVRTAAGDIAVLPAPDDPVFALHDRFPPKGGPLSPA